MSSEEEAGASEEEKEEEMSNVELKRRVRAFIPTVDLAKTGLKSFVKLLSKELGLNLKDRKEFIKDCLMQAMDDQEAKEETKAVKKKASTAAAAAAKKKRKSSGDDEEGKPKKKKKTGLSAVKELSPALASFLGKGESMARTEIVKSLWEYIRENDLQNPVNKREILLDSAMQNVFGCETFTMFTMNKYISAHIHPFTPVDLTVNSTPKKPRKKKAAPGERKSGIQPPHHLSEALQAVVGTNVLPRPQVVAKIWDYIKLHDLQNPNDRREILCDEKLQEVMGGSKTVTMFNMNKHITKHIFGKVEIADVEEEEGDDDDDDDDGDGDVSDE